MLPMYILTNVPKLFKNSGQLLMSSSWNLSKTSIPLQFISRNKVTQKQLDYDIGTVTNSSVLQPGKGKIYDKKPFKFKCIQGKSYLWCTCGWSKSQPFCDSTHKNPHYRITLKPVRFIAPETKEYIFCNCKQTSKRPFCDGTHLKEEIQAAIKS